MSVTLSWDLFVIVFFAIVIAYSFIIGKRESVKIIIATYIAIITVQGLGNILERLLGQSATVLETIGIPFDVSFFATIKLLLFIAVIIAIAIRAGIEVKYLKEPRWIINTALSGLFGFASAGLLLSTVLTYVAGTPLLDQSAPSSAPLLPIVQQSPLMETLALHQDFWFALPALLILVAGIMSNKQ